jgi:hypothetical protein
MPHLPRELPVVGVDVPQVQLMGIHGTEVCHARERRPEVERGLPLGLRLRYGFRMSLGVYFAIDAHTAERLLAAADDEAVAALVEEIEEEIAGVEHCDTDKAWDAIHRSLTDGYLGYDNGTYPLNAVILGGRHLYEGDDHIVTLLGPEQVREAATAATGVDREAFKAGYDQIDVADYGPEFGDEDLAYTWSSFAELVAFLQRAAAADAHVIFTVGL